MRQPRVSMCSLSVFLLLAAGNSGGATFTVTNTNNTGPGSLRNDMVLANLTPGRDSINFQILGPGPYTISLFSQLPPLVDPDGVFIDGLSQPGSSAGREPPSTATLMVVIDGTNAGPSHGFWILTSSNTIRGLVINNFEQDGIRIQGSYEGTNSNCIYCDFVGTDRTGNIARGNGRNQAMFWAGVHIIVTADTVGFAHHNVVQANLISANYAEGVGIRNCPPGGVAFNEVLDNYIGTDIAGVVDLGNIHDGVYIGEGAHNNTVGGNLISGNHFEGVTIVGCAQGRIYANANLVVDNTIGLTINLTPLGNRMDGVSIGQYGNLYQGGYAEENVIAGNTIAHNGRNGVTVWEHFLNRSNGDGNRISQNGIYENGLLGMDLGDDGVSASDPGDPDAGPNEELNFPVITSADYFAGQTTIAGMIDIDTDPAQAVVEVFKARRDPSGYGEGETYLGSAAPDAAGKWSTVVTGLAPGSFVTATTMDRNLNTSEFCRNVSLVVAVEETHLVRQSVRYELAQNRPNPFTSTTTIAFSVLGSRGAEEQGRGLSTYERINLSVYDLSGRLVKTLVDGSQSVTSYESPVAVRWDGRDESGREVSPGVYFCNLNTEHLRATKRMIFMR